MMTVPLFNQFKGRAIKSRLQNPYDAFWDLKLGVQTFGFHPGSGMQGDADWQVHYAPTPYADIFRLLRMVGLGENDVFVDLGCGLGRAVFAASWMGAKRAVGIDVVPALCQRAEENRQSSRLADRAIDFVCDHAANYRHRDTSVLFMFHPFGEVTMRQVLRGIAENLTEESAKNFRIVYRNPVCESVLQEAGWLECIGRVPARSRWLSAAGQYVTSLWRAIPAKIR